MSRVQLILAEATEVLATARFGLDDMRSPRAERRRPGFRVAIVFGRMITFALENLKGKHPAFEDWYAVKQRELSANEMFRRISAMRTIIEHQASTPLSIIYSGTISAEQIRDVLSAAPDNATGLNIGDPSGNSYWTVEAGKVDAEPPQDLVGTFVLVGPDGKPLDDTDAALHVEEWLNHMAALVDEAREVFR